MKSAVFYDGHRIRVEDVIEPDEATPDLVGTRRYPVHDWPRITPLIGTGWLPVEKDLPEVIPVTDVVTRGSSARVSPMGPSHSFSFAWIPRGAAA